LLDYVAMYMYWYVDLTRPGFQLGQVVVTGPGQQALHSVFPAGSLSRSWRVGTNIVLHCFLYLHPYTWYPLDTEELPSKIL